MGKTTGFMEYQREVRLQYSILLRFEEEAVNATFIGYTRDLVRVSGSRTH